MPCIVVCVDCWLDVCYSDVFTYCRLTRCVLLCWFGCDLCSFLRSLNVLCSDDWMAGDVLLLCVWGLRIRIDCGVFVGVGRLLAHAMEKHEINQCGATWITSLHALLRSELSDFMCRRVV